MRRLLIVVRRSRLWCYGSEPWGRGRHLSIPGLGDSTGAGYSGSGGALEALFDPGACDDRVAVAEADAGAKCAVLVPQLVESCVERTDALADLGVVGNGELMPELAALL